VSSLKNNIVIFCFVLLTLLTSSSWAKQIKTFNLPININGKTETITATYCKNYDAAAKNTTVSIVSFSFKKTYGANTLTIMTKRSKTGYFTKLLAVNEKDTDLLPKDWKFSVHCLGGIYINEDGNEIVLVDLIWDFERKIRQNTYKQRIAKLKWNTKNKNYVFVLYKKYNEKEKYYNGDAGVLQKENLDPANYPFHFSGQEINKIAYEILMKQCKHR
jgi:hypothetical protein